MYARGALRPVGFDTLVKVHFIVGRKKKEDTVAKNSGKPAALNTTETLELKTPQIAFFDQLLDNDLLTQTQPNTED